MIKLNWNTYQQLQAHMDRLNHHWHVSALTLLSWVFYGIKIEYHHCLYKHQPVILFAAKFNRFLDENQVEENQKIATILEYGDHFLLFPLFNQDKLDLLEVLAFAFDYLEQIYPIRSDLVLDAIPKSCLDQFVPSAYELVMEWNSNYLYDPEALKFFKGKKLQKKRNFLNYFNNTYAKSVIVSELVVTDGPELINFMELLINQDHGPVQEKLFFHNVINHFNPMTMKGIVVRQRSDKKVIGFTLGYFHKNTYEILFEKALHTWKGLFQFMLSENLKWHNINCQWVDRQDDAGMENLRQSKMSYYPSKVVQMALIAFH